ALRTLQEQGVEPSAVASLLSEGLIVPVLTAHPSEVRRKSVLDRQAAIARDVDALDQPCAELERQHAENDLRRQVSILWRTRLLRNVRVAVADEIENALSYFEHSFLPALPGLYAAWEATLGSAGGQPGGLPSFLRVGS